MDTALLGPVLAELLHGPRGQAQRAAGLALHRTAPGPVPAIAARTEAELTPPARSTAARRPVRRRLGQTAATAAVTVSPGVAAPLAYAYTDAPARFTVVSHYLDEDGRCRRPSDR
ncbi:hypothetical protein [Streptomyces sp. NPDC047079]|uniref:hypothetical protein n=1 Tax=Streptomyces sp. NPDC047079 TaxID=3154607 RepID=UPI0033F0217E